MALDPLSQVYTGQDNSGAAIIYKDGTPEPIPTVLALLQRKADMAHREKIAAAKQPKNTYKDLPNYSGASYDAPYLTKVRDEIIDKSRGLYDGSLTPEQKIERQLELDQMKGRAFLMAHKSAELDKEFQLAYKDFSNRPWSYDKDFEKKAKEYIDTPLEDRGVFQYKKRNESDYVKSMQAVDIKPHVTAWDEDVANGRMQRTEMHKLVKGAIDTGWKIWSSNTNSPDVMALYDHADEELRKQYGDKYDQLPADQKTQMINKMGKVMFAESQGIKLGADGNWVTTYKTGLKNAPKGGVTKQKTIDEMSDIQYDNKYNTSDKSGLAKTAASYTIVHPKKNTAVLQLSSDMYDTLTKKPVTAKGSVTFIPGQIHVADHLTTQVDKGTKKATGSTTIATAFVTGTYKTQEPVMDDKGKQAKDMNGALKFKTVEKSIIVPLKDMEGMFKETGEQYQWAYDLADKINSEKLTSNKKESDGFDYSQIKY